jgi:superfamily II DNA helicase RecQ
MDDQCFNLRAKGIVAEMLNASTTQDASRSIMRRLLGNSQPKAKGKGKGKAKVEDDEEIGDEETIKLVYVRRDVLGR